MGMYVATWQHAAQMEKGPFLPDVHAKTQDAVPQTRGQTTENTQVHRRGARSMTSTGPHRRVLLHPAACRCSHGATRAQAHASAHAHAHDNAHGQAPAQALVEKSREYLKADSNV